MGIHLCNSLCNGSTNLSGGVESCVKPDSHCNLIGNTIMKFRVNAVTIIFIGE